MIKTDEVSGQVCADTPVSSKGAAFEGGSGVSRETVGFKTGYEKCLTKGWDTVGEPI
jgi:hypothetical protein